MSSRLPRVRAVSLAVVSTLIVASFVVAGPVPSVGLYWLENFNPTTGGGVNAPLNQLLIRTDQPSIWYKSGAANTAWTELGSPGGSGGTVTSVSCGVGISCSPSPIVAAGSVTLNITPTTCGAGQAEIATAADGTSTCAAFGSGNITGTLTPTFMPYASSAHVLADSLLSFDAANTKLSANAQLKLTSPTQPDDNTHRALDVSQTLASVTTASRAGAGIVVTGAGSSAFPQSALAVTLAPGFSGASQSYGIIVNNDGNGTGDNFALYAYADGTGSNNYGARGLAFNSAGSNVGADGRSYPGSGTGHTVGLFGQINTVPSNVLAALDAAVWGDNGATGKPIFLGTTANGATRVFVVGNAGGIFGNTNGVYGSADGSFGCQAGTNASASCFINFYGYAPDGAGGFPVPGTTQFRNLVIADGKGATIALVTGSTKATVFSGAVTANVPGIVGTATALTGGATGAGTLNVGVMGSATGATDNIGVFAGLTTSVPASVSAALVIENGATGKDLILAQNNGSTSMELTSGGTLIMTGNGAYLTGDGVYSCQAATNGVATCYVGYYGYAPSNVPGTTQFRNVVLANGKGVAVVSTTGSTSTTLFASGMSSNSASAPTVTVCTGTGFSQTGGAWKGKIIPATGATSCTVTFASNLVSCTVTDETLLPAYSISGAALTITNAALGATKVHYDCSI